MTHDPLCPMHPDYEFEHYCCGSCNPGAVVPWEPVCICTNLARVREDEAQGQSEALLKAQRVFLREGYAAALRDAVEAVRDRCIEHDDSDGRPEDLVFDTTPDRLIAAIEALGEER